jgi:hypothetical protein
MAKYNLGDFRAQFPNDDACLLYQGRRAANRLAASADISQLEFDGEWQRARNEINALIVEMQP